MNLETFLRAEDGAVTVDWVPLMTAVLALGLAVAGAVSGGAMTAADGVATYLGEVTVLETGNADDPAEDTGATGANAVGVATGAGTDTGTTVSGTDRGGPTGGGNIVRISGRVGR